ncbi:cytosol aminopeptidase family, catalytic domain protein, partial [Chlamydia psittaci 84-8471/1]
RYC